MSALTLVHDVRVAPYDELRPDGSMPAALRAEFDLAWRIVEKHKQLHTSELLGALSVCGFALSERELVALAGPEMLDKPKLSREEFCTLYLRLVATGQTLDVAIRRAFGMFDEDHDGALPIGKVRDALRLAAAASDGGAEGARGADARADALARALGLEAHGGQLGVRHFAAELRATLAQTAELLPHTAATGADEQMVALTLEVDRERREEEERRTYAAELAELQPELDSAIGSARPPIDRVAIALAALHVELRAGVEFAVGEAKFEAEAEAEALFEQLARALVEAALLLRAHSQPPLALSLEAHSADTEPRAKMAALTLRRAEAARALLRDKLRAVWPAELTRAGVHDTHVLIDAVGHGGSRARARRALEARLLSAGEAARIREEAAAEAAAAAATGSGGGGKGRAIGGGVPPGSVGVEAAADARTDKAERAAYGQSLGEVQADAERQIGARAPLVRLELRDLRISLARQWEFKGNEAEYIEAAAERELTAQLALALGEVHAALAARGMRPLVVVLEGHTVNAEPADFNEALSLLRAQRVRTDLLDALLIALPDGAVSHDDLRARIVARGLGGSTLRERSVRLRVLAPSEATEQLRAHGAAGAAGVAAAVATDTAAASLADGARAAAFKRVSSSETSTASQLPAVATSASAAARQAYGRELAAVQPGAEARLRSPLRLVTLDLRNLTIRLARQFDFAEEAAYADEQAEGELLDELAAVLGAVHAECEARGLPPPHVSVEGHTYHSQPRAEVETRSLARAVRVMDDIVARLLALPRGAASHATAADVHALFSAVGHGGVLGRGSCVELAILSPDEAEAARARELERGRAGTLPARRSTPPGSPPGGTAERAAYARALGALQPALDARLGETAPLVRVRLGGLQIGLERQFEFAGDAATYESNQAEDELLDELAAALHAVGDAARGAALPPPVVELGGHTANAEPRGDNEALSLLRAQRVRDDLSARLRGLATDAEGEPMRIVCRGYGGSVMLRRCVTVTLLAPADAAAAADSSTASGGRGSGAVGGDGADDDDEAKAYRALLGEVQAEVTPLVCALRLVTLDLPALQIGLERQFEFAGDAATYKSDQAEDELLDELAAALHAVNGRMGARGLPPLAIALEGHTANAEPAQYNDDLSLQRAQTVKADLITRMRALGADAEPLGLAITCRGYGGRALRRRCVQVRVLLPAEARHAQRDEAAREGALAADRAAGGAARGMAGGVHADFSGAWVLHSSERLDEFLRALNVGPLKRKLASGFKPSQEWNRNAHGDWQMVVQSPVGAKTELLPIGRPISDEIDGIPLVKTSHWERGALVTTVTQREPRRKGEPQLPDITLRRYVRARDGGGEELVLEMEAAGVVCERVFARPAGYVRAVNPVGAGGDSRGSLGDGGGDGGAPPRTARPEAPALAVTAVGEDEGEAVHAASMAAFARHGAGPRTPAGTPTPSPVRAPSSAPPPPASAGAGGDGDGAVAPNAPSSPSGAQLTAAAVEAAASAPPTPSAPGSSVDFSGSWVLTRSAKLDEYLSALGVNYIKRAAAARMAPKHEWERTDEGWQFTTQRPALGPKTEALPIGREVDDDVDGIAVLKLSRWEGDVLVTDVTPTDPARRSKMARMTMRRYLLGSGADAKLVLEMTYGDIVCTREFSRA